MIDSQKVIESGWHQFVFSCPERLSFVMNFFPPKSHAFLFERQSEYLWNIIIKSHTCTRTQSRVGHQIFRHDLCHLNPKNNALSSQKAFIHVDDLRFSRRKFIKDIIFWGTIETVSYLHCDNIKWLLAENKFYCLLLFISHSKWTINCFICVWH